ncbi:MAG: outer membrane lipoprotein-sorting protein [Spirosomaceae bacterium]|nr:outer membrane lipoprotein-sorting protein [Spirosomataceae bacterium]
MKTLKSIALTAILSLAAWSVQAQTVDEVIDKYFENTGGKAKWAALKSIKISGKAKAQGMEIPLTIVQEQGGKQKVSINFQGKEITQVAFDGSNAWTTNFQTMKAEKMEAEETENMKINGASDFPDPFLGYKDKGYKAELEGKETIEGTECFKVKLTKKPIKVDGKSEDEVSYYFFDTQNFVPIMSRTTGKKGQMKGIVQETLMSDYQETSSGIMMPFSMSMKFNGQVGQAMTADKVETNITIDPKEYVMPEGK